jgi:large subunit ribosomal protein L1
MKKKINFDKTKLYPIDEAIKLVKENAKAKFDESLEVHIRLGIDTAKGEQQIRGTVALPNGTGKTKKVAVFTLNEKEAIAAGADMAGGKDLIDKIRTTGAVDFEVAVATPEMMKELSQVAKILGPKGLMPSPKNQTVTTDVAKTIKELKGGRISFKNDETANLHQMIGKVSWDADKLKENFVAFVEAVRKAKPASVKGVYLKQVVVCSTMGPGVKVEV